MEAPGETTDVLAMTDQDLLARYARERSEEAFHLLVDRHHQMVYAACRRGLGGDREAARDAAQSVFLVLAEKAKSLSSHGNIAGWLFRTATYVVRDIRKAERRRLIRESQAIQAMQGANGTESPAAGALAGQLNDALMRLNPKLRETVILCHLESHTLGEAARRLGCSEEAAKKRLQRGEEDLRAIFRRKGYVVTVAILFGALKAEAAVAAGAEVATACQAAAAGLGGVGLAAASVALAKGVLAKMVWFKVKTAAAILAMFGAAAGTAELWKKVEEARSKGLPRSAIESLEPIIAITQDQKAWAEAIKAVALKIALEGQIQGNKAEEKVVRMQAEIAKAPAEMKPVMEAILAHWIWEYFQRHRWQFMQRTQTGTPPGPDITTWDLPRILAEIDRQFEKALAAEARLKAIPIGDYDALLSKGTVPDAYRPTLYDFLAHDALAFYQTGEHAGSKAEDAFELTADSPVFAPAPEFMAWAPRTPDARSITLKAVKLHQTLLAFHRNDKDRTAFADADLLRLNFGHNRAAGEEKRERYAAALKRFADEWADHEISARALWHLSGERQAAGDLVEAHVLAKRGWNAFPESIGGKWCWNRMQEIEGKQVGIATERVWNEPWPTINVCYKNVTKAHFRAVPWEFEERLKADRHPESLDELAQKALLSRKPALEWSADLPATPDYQDRIESLPAPKGLAPGFYFIVASHDPSFGNKNNQVSYAAVWVSDLALVVRSVQDQGQVEGFVLDARTGEPRPDAAVKAWARHDRGFRFLGETKTDGNGLFRFAALKANSGAVVVLARRGDHQLASDEHWVNVRDDRDPPYGQTVFFTDRSIYRPGQTIQYKGICIRVNQASDAYEALAGQAVTVIFSDWNRKEIARQRRQANDHGSFSGSFTAPRAGLTGRMQIHVVENEIPGSTWVHVEEYKRPKFQVAIEAPKEGARLSGEVKLAGKATAYTGAAIGGAKVAWRVTRGVQYPPWRRWCVIDRWAPQAGEIQEIAHGTATTSADGAFAIAFKAAPDRSIDEREEPTFVFTAAADVTDTTGETRSGQRQIRVGYTALSASMTANDWQEAGKPVEIAVKTATLDGEGQAARGVVKVYALKQPETVSRPKILSYESPSRHRRGDRLNGGRGKDVKRPAPAPDPADPNSWELGDLAEEKAFVTNESGSEALTFQLKAGMYRAMLETKDRFGKPVAARLPVQVEDPRANRHAAKLPNRVAAPAWSLEPGRTFLALWGTGYDAGRAYIEIEHRRKIVKAFWTSAERTQEVVELPVTESMRGGFTFRTTFVRENRAYLEARRVDVPWTNKNLEIKWEHFVSKLGPAQKETWTAVIAGPDAKRAAAEMVAGLYDASLDAYQPHAWLERFAVWRIDRSSLHSQFENHAQGFANLHGAWPRDYKQAELTYRDLPSEFAVPRWEHYRWKQGIESAAKGRWAEADKNLGEYEFANRLLRDRNGTDGDLALRGEHLSSAVETPPPAPDLGRVAARRNLNETAFFFPHLLSGPDGVVRIEFTMPEALTEWAFMGFAHDKALRSGFLKGKAVTSKDLMVEPNPPRFVREGDEIEFTVKVSNRSAARQSGTVRLTLSDARTQAPVDAALKNVKTDLPFDVPAGESRAFAWRLAVPDAMGFLAYKAVGSTGRLSDGEEGYLPVLSRRILVTESLPLPVRGAQAKEFEFRKLLDSRLSATLKHESLTVQMVSQPAWYAVMALPYLMESSNDCVEATFNRLYANALARHIANSDPKIRRVFDQWKGTPALDSPLEKNQDLKSVMLEETPWLRQAQAESQARKNVGILFDENRLASEAAALAGRLRDLQLGDGLWPWFPGGRGDRYITLYIATGFGRLRHLGVKPVDVACALKALGALDAWMDELYRDIVKHGKRDEAHINATVALTLYGRSFFLADRPIEAKHREAADYWLGQARTHWLKLERQSQGHVALALKRFGDAETPAGILKSLKERSVTDDELGRFWRDTEETWWWYRAPIETQALMIEAFDEVAGDATAVEECRVWILKQKQTQDWKTTKATADAIYGLLLRGGNWLASDALVEVSVGGQAIQPERVEAGTGFYEKRFLRREIEPGMGKIAVKKTDGGVSWGSVHWQYLEDIGKITPHEGTPLKLVKKLFVKENTRQGPALRPVKDPLAVGDELVARIELRTDRDMEYVHLKDQRGSGTEPVNVLSRYRYQDGLRYYESTRDTASHFYIDYLPKGVYVFEYSVRVQHKGKYPSGLASIQCLYAPEFNGHSGSVELEVR